ncbi:hypothetical protein AGLY_009694, partial [Aphis glycines]
FLKCPDTCNYDELDLHYFEWMNMDKFEFELIDLQFCNTWKQKFIDLRPTNRQKVKVNHDEHDLTYFEWMNMDTFEFELIDLQFCNTWKQKFIDLRQLIEEIKINPLPLKDVNSIHKGLVMYNNVRWLSRGNLLERFVECLHEIRLFLSENQKNYTELTDINWLCNLMFFTDLCLHLNELNLKLQGTGKNLEFMFSLIKSFETKLNLFIRNIEKHKFKYFQHLNKFLSEIEINEIPKFDENINNFLSIIKHTIQQINNRFIDFKKFECNIKFLKCPDTCNYDELDLHYFEWMNMDTFEFELIDLQFCNTWKQKFIDLRQLIEEIKINRDDDEDVNSIHKGLVMYNNVRWLSRGNLLERFVECLHEIRLFLSENQKNYTELTDINWLCNLMFFTDLCLHLNELNLKLQGTGKNLEFMFSLIKSFETKLNVFIRDIENHKFKYFQHLNKFLSEIEINGTPKLVENINNFLSIIKETIQQINNRFIDFKKFECNFKFLKCPDTCNYDELDLHYFEWMNMDTFEFELIDLQFCNTWKQKFIDLRQLIEEIKINHDEHEDVNSIHKGLVMYNNVRWLSRGNLLERFVECLHEIRLFLSENQKNYTELTDINWLCNLMFFTDLCLHLNELNLKLQGTGKNLEFMFSLIKSFETKLNVFIRDIENHKFKYFQHLNKFLSEIEINGTPKLVENINNFLSIIKETIQQINNRFIDFKKFECNFKFLKCPDTCNYDELDLHYFEWMNMDTFEFELIDLQFCNTWKQKFIDLRQLIEEIKINRLQANVESKLSRTFKLNKRRLSLLLEDVNSIHKGLVMYNNVRWLSRGNLLERFVECLHEIRLFLSENQKKYTELTDINWLCNLMFFTDLCLHLNELNLKLQGTGKNLEFMFSLIKSFETKLNVFIRDIENHKFKYFQHLNKFLSEIEINGTPKLVENINNFLSIIKETIQQINNRFIDFKKFECNFKFLKCPDTCNYDELDLHYFEWMNMDTFEFELIDLQFCNTWKQKFIDLRQLIEEIKINRLQANVVKNVDTEIFKVWNSLPNTFNT